MIQRHCPLLEDLAVNVQRWQGDSREMAVYRALARIPRLCRLEIRLDCWSPDSEPRRQLSGNGADADPGEGSGHPPDDNDSVVNNAEWVVKHLVNLAIDEPLAQAIFHEVSALTGPQLELLKVTPRFLPLRACMYDSDVLYWVEWLLQTWEFTGSEKYGELTIRRWRFMSMDEDYLRENIECFEVDDRDVRNELWPGDRDA